MTGPATQELQSSSETNNLFTLDTLDFFTKQIHLAKDATNITKKERFEASQILAAAKLDSNSRMYIQSLTQNDLNSTCDVIAIIKKKHYLNADDDKNYSLVEPSMLLEYIATIGRRDEFMQQVNRGKTTAELEIKKASLPEDDPRRQRESEDPRKWGFNTMEELLDFFNTEDEITSSVVEKLSEFVLAEDLSKFVPADKKSVQLKIAKGAFLSFSLFNHLFPEGNQKRQIMLSKLGFPENLPYIQRRPQSTPSEDVAKGILELRGNKPSLPLAA